MELHLLRADVSSIKVDAIVAPSTSPRELSGRPVVVTGGNLLARFVIHVHVPHANDADADEQLRASTLMAIEKAEELAVASLGLPPVAAGSFGFPIDRCARVMVGAAHEFGTRARSLQRIVFCLFGPVEYAAFERALGETGD